MKRVLIESRDLFFRAKLQELVRAAGAEVTRDAPYDLAVVELGKSEAEARISSLVGEGITVLAFGSHVTPEKLRTARALGAHAVPNSQVESALRALL